MARMPWTRQQPPPSVPLPTVPLPPGVRHRLGVKRGAPLDDLSAFRGQFPELVTISDDIVTSRFRLADVILDPLMWEPTDFPMARLLLTAHYCLLATQMLANAADGTGMSDLFVRQISFGDRRVAFQQRKALENVEETSGPGETLLATTVYGLDYLQLRARAITPVLIC